MTPLLSDARLARQASDGNQRAFAAIYKRYHQDIYRFCLSILSRPEDAQDALQNTMVKALRALPGERREIQLRPWLYRVAHNESIDLLRRRREGPELESTPLEDRTEVAETVAVRERLERLLGDLGELPERQRSALVMRELAGLGYEQIGEAFETSGAVARQTVYEARLSLRDLEAGREMSCDEVTRQLSEADGRVTRRRDIQAHLRACSECRAFRDSIDSRRRDLAALTPLPVAAAASILHGLAGGKLAAGGSLGGAGGLGGAATTAGVGAGKVAGTSMIVKAVATVAVATTVGVSAADRSGLVDVGFPGGKNDSGKEIRDSGTGSDPFNPASGQGAANSGAETRTGDDGVTGATRTGQDGAASTHKRAKHEAAGHAGPPATAGKGSPGNGPPASLPQASRHGQETAAANKANGTDNPGQSARQKSTSRSKSGPPDTSKGHRHHPEKSRSPEHAGKGTSKAKSPPPPPPLAKPEKDDPAPAEPETTTGGDASLEGDQDQTGETEASP